MFGLVPIGANRCQSVPRLRPNLQDADTVVSLAWAPAEEELLVAGLASGFLVLWVSLLQILADSQGHGLEMVVCLTAESLTGRSEEKRQMDREKR